MRRIWQIKSVDESSVSQLARSLDVPPLIARLLIHRGASSSEAAKDFLCQELGALAPPEQMADLSRAASLIRTAIRAKERILIVGDYDVDGLTSSAVLYRLFYGLGADVQVHIPHRLEEGYGLKSAVIEEAQRSGVKLLVTADCGTTSFEELEFAGSRGIQTIVVDQHDLKEDKRPPASAFLNPLQPGCAYPEKEMSSVGVAFTLARGLLQSEPGGLFKAWKDLDLVALGTIADVAPLTGENRILVKTGLYALRGTRKPGLRALLSRVGLAGQELSPEEVSFNLAPPINAAGRIGSAEKSFRLLITEDAQEAEVLASAICQENRNRAALGRTAFQRALSKVTREIDFNQDRVIVLGDEEWHPGVIGILAARLARRFHRPAVVISLRGPLCRGSARSIQPFHLTEALHSVREHLVDFGGHPGAAGLTIARDRVGGFREALNRVAHEKLTSRMLTPLVEVDAELPLSAITDELMRDLELLAPFGTGNPRPVFVCHEARLVSNGSRREFNLWGVPLTVESAEGRAFEAFHPREWAGEGFHPRRFQGKVRIAYSPVRRPNGPEGNIELRVRDLTLPV